MKQLNWNTIQGQESSQTSETSNNSNDNSDLPDDDEEEQNRYPSSLLEINAQNLFAMLYSEDNTNANHNSLPFIWNDIASSTFASNNNVRQQQARLVLVLEVLEQASILLESECDDDEDEEENEQLQHYRTNHPPDWFPTETATTTIPSQEDRPPSTMISTPSARRPGEVLRTGSFLASQSTTMSGVGVTIMPTATGEQDESPPAPGDNVEDYNDDDNNTSSYRPRFH